MQLQIPPLSHKFHHAFLQYCTKLLQTNNLIKFLRSLTGKHIFPTLKKKKKNLSNNSILMKLSRKFFVDFFFELDDFFFNISAYIEILSQV